MLRFLLKASGLVLLIAGTALAASADVLPLKHGRYVNAGTPCREASRATIMPFNGRGFDISDNGCRYASRKVGANRYSVTADCSNVGEGKSTDIYEIRSPTAFVITADGIVRRWCAPSELPSWTKAVPIN